MHYFRNYTLGSLFIHERQPIYTPGILLADNGSLCAGDKKAFKNAPFFIRTCAVARGTKWSLY